MSQAEEDTLCLRRRECGDFLRVRRERLQPADVGLPSGVRRRTPGLRREEVAMLAGVGTTWYSWLEQGRDVRPSVAVLTALADALRLDPIERRHLLQLQDRMAQQSVTPERTEIDPSLHRLLHGLNGQPAFVVGRRWDILAWNVAAKAVLGDFERLQGDARNALHLMFADQAYRRLFVDWESVAKPALAMFRSDCVGYLGDPDVRHLVSLLEDLSHEFRTWWRAHEVIRPVSNRKHLCHSVVGEMDFEFSILTVPNDENTKVLILTPTDRQTAGKLARLLSDGLRMDKQ